MGTNTGCGRYFARPKLDRPNTACAHLFASTCGLVVRGSLSIPWARARGSRHGNSATVSFADQHAETFRWTGGRVLEGSGILRTRFKADPAFGDSSISVAANSPADLRDLRRLQGTVPALGFRP